jgi:Polyketide cyclase / dehydrase and lipid transport
MKLKALQNMRSIQCLLINIILSVSPVYGADIDFFSLHYEGSIANLVIFATVAAPVEDIRRVLTDYEHLEQLHPAVKESTVLARWNNQAQVRTRIGECILFFCTDFIRVEDIHEDHNGVITASVIPESSDMSYGITTWSLHSQRDLTRVFYTVRMQPTFWVPPIIGTYFLKSRLRKGFMELVNNLEAIANK